MIENFVQVVAVVLEGTELTFARLRIKGAGDALEFPQIERHNRGCEGRGLGDRPRFRGLGPRLDGKLPGALVMEVATFTLPEPHGLHGFFRPLGGMARTICLLIHQPR